MRPTTLAFVFAVTLFPYAALAQNGEQCNQDGNALGEACKKAFEDSPNTIGQCNRCSAAATSLCRSADPPGSFSVLSQCKIRTAPGGCNFQKSACKRLCNTRTPPNIFTRTPAKPGLIEDFDFVEACETGCTADDSCDASGVFNPRFSEKACIDAGDAAHVDRVAAGENSGESDDKRNRTRLACFKFFGPEILGGKFRRNDGKSPITIPPGGFPKPGN